LESEFSPNYQRCCSMASRQVFEVPPASVGGSLYSIGVCSRGGDTHKVSDWVLLHFMVIFKVSACNSDEIESSYADLLIVCGAMFPI